MNDTGIKAKDLVESVKRLKPEVEQKKLNAEIKSKRAEEEEKNANLVLISQSKVKEEVERMKREADEFLKNSEKELKDAEKFKASASQSVEKLKEDSIREVGTYKQEFILKLPGVDKVLQAVLQIVNGKPNLTELKSTLSKPKNLKLFDLNLIETEFEKYRKICNIYRAWYENDKEQINPESMASKSAAIFGLQDWTVNILKQQAKIEVVVPLKANSQRAKEEAEEMQAKLDEEMKKYHELMMKVEILREERDEALKEANDLEDTLRRYKIQLANSGSLTESLEDEYQRWNKNVDELMIQITNLVGDVYISSAAMSQQGPFTGHQRDMLVEQWLDKINSLNLPCTQEFELENIISNSLEIRNWRVNGLPTDKVSCCNACLATKSLRIPIIIDPQELAFAWMSKMGSKMKMKNDESNQFKMVKAGDKTLTKVVEKALELGWTIVIQDCGEKLENNIDLLLMHKANSIGDTSESIEYKFGDKECKIHAEFKMYLLTKISNPNQLPETFIKSTVINFLVTQEGLEEDLLSKTVSILKPEDEEMRSSLIEKIAKNDTELSFLESNILETLLETQLKEGQNVLEDDKLIQMLKDSKTKSQEIHESKEEAELSNQRLLTERKKYINVAVRCSILYFILTDLALIDPMQQFSLEKIFKLFKQVIEKEKEILNSMENPIDQLVEQVTSQIFQQCSRSIFEEHKLVFSFFIAIKIGIREKSLTNEEYLYFLTANKPGFDNYRKNPLPWLEDKVWNQICMLEVISNAQFNLTTEITKNPDEFKAQIFADNINDLNMPGVYDYLDNFKKALFVRTVRPEKLMFMMKKQIIEKIGDSQANPPPIKLNSILEDSEERTPIIFILSKGADPSDSIKDMAKNTSDKSQQIRELSLGSGSEDKAVQAIQRGASEGNWVILCNCHLFEDWLVQLLAQCERLKDPNTKVNKDFRLFLTSMPCKKFPVQILQNGTKVAQEPPKGLKKNIIGSLIKLDEEYFDNKVKLNVVNFKRLIFGAVFLHGVILERKKFGPLGFNKLQDFNESDLNASLDTLCELCNRGVIPYDAIEQMIGEITQGGRVTEELDFRTLRCTLKMFLNQEVNTDTQQKYSPSGIYQVPEVKETDNFESWINQIKLLPDQDPPEIFGMHSNADITFQYNTSMRQINNIMITMSDESAEDDSSNNDKIVNDIIKKQLELLPDVIKRSEASKTVKERGNDGMISIQTTFLQHEIEKFSILLVKMKETLATLQDAIKGIALMSIELDKMFNCFLINKVPPNWMKLSFLSLKPLGSWFEDLIQRVDQLRHWLTTECPYLHCLTVQQFPQGFLTAVLQSHARKQKIEIDTLDFSFDTIPQVDYKLIKTPPANGIQIQGLQLDGMGYNFDKNECADQVTGVTQCQSPIFNFIPTKDSKVRNKDQLCPVYKTTLRSGTLTTTGASSNQIRSISLQQSMPSPDQWIKKGAAIVCNLND